MSTSLPVELHVETLSRGTSGIAAGARGLDRRIVLVHGFTQNSRCWAPFDRLLAEAGPVTGVDLPGHGRSGPPTADLWATGRAVVSAAPAAVHLGYSLGGRVLLHAALSRPAAVNGLVLIGSHPGIEDSTERQTRRAEDEQRAGHIEQVGLEEFLDEWLALPLFASLGGQQSHRRERLTNEAGAVAEALRQLGTGVQEPLWSRLPELDMPVLVLAGAKDLRYVGLCRRVVDEIGANASFTEVPGVGHAAHLEDPRATAAIVLDWIDAITV